MFQLWSHDINHIVYMHTHPRHFRHGIGSQCLGVRCGQNRHGGSYKSGCHVGISNG